MVGHVNSYTGRQQSTEKKRMIVFAFHASMKCNQITNLQRIYKFLMSEKKNQVLNYHQKSYIWHQF